jgi:hypothetical protein
MSMHGMIDAFKLMIFLPAAQLEKQQANTAKLTIILRRGAG